MGWKNVISIIFLIFLVFIFTGIVFIGLKGDNNINLSPEIPQNSPEVGEREVITVNSENLHYENIRFQSRNIDYSIDFNCSQERMIRINEAFNLLSEKTVLKFNRVISNGNVQVYCFDSLKNKDQKYHIIGSTGLVSLINTSKYYVVTNSSIYLYGEEKCDKPVYALHEILHVLGFQHSQNTKSIMYEVLACDQDITQEIINKLDSLYIEPTLPDLTIQNVTYEKSGKFLSIKIVVLNSGLSYVNSTSLSIYQNNNKLKEFPLGGFDIGAVKVMTFDKIKLINDYDNVLIKIDDNNLIEEIDELNNERIISF